MGESTSRESRDEERRELLPPVDLPVETPPLVTAHPLITSAITRNAKVPKTTRAIMILANTSKLNRRATRWTIFSSDQVMNAYETALKWCLAVIFQSIYGFRVVWWDFWMLSEYYDKSRNTSVYFLYWSLSCMKVGEKPWQLYDPLTEVDYLG